MLFTDVAILTSTPHCVKADAREILSIAHLATFNRRAEFFSLRLFYRNRRLHAERSSSSSLAPIPRWTISKLAKKYDIDARSFSETSHVVMLMLAHLMHAYCLTEVCDNASMYAGKLKLARHATTGASVLICKGGKNRIENFESSTVDWTSTAGNKISGLTL